MKRIGVVTGTRAEYGLLKPVMQRVKEDDSLELCLIVTGMHLEEKFGYTYHFIENDGYHIDYTVPMKLEDDSTYGVVGSMSLEMQGFAEVLQDADLDMVVLLGDRYETLIAAVSAMMYKIPIAHIHGGEITEGAIDDAIRHAITKMSTLHFASTKAYAKRICQMGEEPHRVFAVGAPGVENIKSLELYEREELIETYEDVFSKPYMMVTYHPVTMENHTAGEQFGNLLHVIENHSEWNYCFTYANSDMDGDVINQMIKKYVESHENACAYVSMGQKGYLSALKYCDGVIGNSSSGIIEAPSFEIPTLNIGDRQKGRLRAESVIDTGNSKEEIEEGFLKITSKEWKAFCKTVENPYYGEHTSDRILEEMKKYLTEDNKKVKKFYDVMV